MKKILIGLLMPLFTVSAICPSCRQQHKNCTEKASEKGQLVVCFASKGDFAPSATSTEALTGITDLVHRYGIPVTYYMKPFTAEKHKSQLKKWHEEYGDEVGWFSEGITVDKAQTELDQLRSIVDWQVIRTTGNIRYGADWVQLYQANGIESVWGRCYEQTYTDNITDRGCPFGFYYLYPACFKVPNKANGGLISVPWLSNDLNLIFRTAQQSTFTFDVNDPQDIRVATAEDDSFWLAELNEYKKQTRYNKIVPLVIQQEFHEFALSEPGLETRRKEGYALLESLFKILQREGIKVVTVSEAVDMYKAAYPEKTPPTYGLFDNIARHVPIVRDCKHLELTNRRFATGKGPCYNGYYATNREDRMWYYYHPDSIPYYEHGKLLTYYDVNGLLVFEEGKKDPIRITPYTSLPENLFGEAILPEMSYWYDTDRFIPRSELRQETTADGFVIDIRVKAEHNQVFTGEELPYGVMLWGDYSNYEIPADAPLGTKILQTEGLFIPMLLEEGMNEIRLFFKEKL